VPPGVADIAPADPKNGGTALWNNLLKVPVLRKLYDLEVKLQVFIQGIWGLQYVALATHWLIKDEVSWHSNRWQGSRAIDSSPVSGPLPHAAPC